MADTSPALARVFGATYGDCATRAPFDHAAQRDACRIAENGGRMSGLWFWGRWRRRTHLRLREAGYTCPQSPRQGRRLRQSLGKGAG